MSIARNYCTFAIHRLSYIIAMDNGSSFKSNEFKIFCTMKRIKHNTAAPYHSLSNGPAIKAPQTFKYSMKKLGENSYSDLITSINRFLSYRNTPHSFISLSPAELLINQKIKTRLNLLK